MSNNKDTTFEWREIIFSDYFFSDDKPRTKNQDVPEKMTFPLLVFTLATVIFDKTLCDKSCIKV